MQSYQRGSPSKGSSFEGSQSAGGCQGEAGVVGPGGVARAAVWVEAATEVNSGRVVVAGGGAEAASPLAGSTAGGISKKITCI